jgi:transcriptional regulator GlxA family with amidase domain
MPETEAILLAQRLQLYPQLRASVERMLQIVENQRGDAFLADDAEELVVQEMRRYGQEALQTWAERRNHGVEQRHAQRRKYQRVEKKDSGGAPA